MGKYIAYMLLAAATLLFDSCTYVNTHRAVADRGRQCQAVILPDQESLVLYQHKGDIYLQGVLTQVRRAGRDKITSCSVNEYTSGQYIPIKNAPKYYVYRKISPADIVKDDYYVQLAGKQIPRGARKVKPAGYVIDSLNCNPVTTHLQYGWQASLPKKARKLRTNMVTSEHQQVGSHLSNTRSGFIIPVSRMRTNKHAFYAYPAAGISFVLIDIPGTILANTVVPVAYGIAAIPCSIYQKGRQYLVKPDK